MSNDATHFHTPGRAARQLRPAPEAEPAPPQLAVMDGLPGADRRARRPDGSVVKLSLLMPSFDEGPTVAKAVRSVLDQVWPCEIELIVVDDGSTDATYELVAQIHDPRLRLLRHPANLGKGAALLTAAAVATGTHIVPFDADLEYASADVVKMLQPVLAGRTDLVYGVRLFGVNTVYPSYRFALGNRALTTAANVLFDSYLSDLHTCLKLMPLSLFRELNLREHGFGLDTEVTARILRRGLRPFEVPVSYHGRGHANGKKITWRDGVRSAAILARVRFDRALDQAKPAPAQELPAAAEAVDPLQALGTDIERRLTDAATPSRRRAAR